MSRDNLHVPHRIDAKRIKEHTGPDRAVGYKVILEPFIKVYHKKLPHYRYFMWNIDEKQFVSLSASTFVDLMAKEMKTGAFRKRIKKLKELRKSGESWDFPLS